MQTYYYYSLGCKVNTYECAGVASLLIKKGYKFSRNNPDIIIVNTCAVTSVAEKKSRHYVYKFRAQFPKAILVVMGCQTEHSLLRKQELYDADIIVGTSNRNKVVEYIDEFSKTKQKIVKIDANPRFFNTYEEFGTTSCGEYIRAFLKIQDGCDNFCSYCLIPFIRGKSRSRKSTDVLLEAEHLVEAGYQELVVSGIDIGSYGIDNGDISFSSLIEKLLDIKGLKRLRISSIEASQIDDKLVDLYRTNNILVSHLHVPLQSGSETVLKRMNRKYDKKEYLEKIRKIKEVREDIALTTDVIVGFPGETDEEFNETKSFIRACGFNMLHVFPYSSREGTKASLEKNKVPANVKKERVLSLLNLSSELWSAYTDTYVGKEIEVLVEQYDSKTKRFYGHTGNYIEVSVECTHNIIGKFINTIYKK